MKSPYQSERFISRGLHPRLVVHDTIADMTIYRALQANPFTNPASCVFFIGIAYSAMNACMLTESPTEVNVCAIQNRIPQRGPLPILVTYSSSSSVYLRYSILSFEVAYLNLSRVSSWVPFRLA
jgi:hypothetical protein